MLQYAPTVTTNVSTLIASPEGCQDLYRQYLADISSLQRLEPGEDDLLMWQLAQARRGERSSEEAQEIAQRLVEGSLRLVMYIANDYYRHLLAVNGGKISLSRMDLIQTGNMALIECVQRCLTHEVTNPNFSAYAGTYIRYALLNYRNRSWFVCMSTKRWRAILQSGMRSLLSEPLSLESTPAGGDDDRPLIDRIVEPSPLSENIQARERVEALLSSLPEREQRVLRLRYGLDPEDQRPHSFDEIADKMGDGCPSTYSNLEQQALRALREGVTLKTSPDYYSFSEACQVLGISHTAFIERVHKGLIHSYKPFATDQVGVYPKAEIDALAEEYRRIAVMYYTLVETASRLGVCVRAVKNWAKDGKLTRHYFPAQEHYNGLYLREEVERLVREREELAQRFYTREEAAKRLGIAPVSVNRWAREGRLHPQNGYYAKAEVEQLVREQEMLRRDYYTVEQAAARMNFTTAGFGSWTERTGIIATRRSLDGTRALYLKSTIDALAEQEQRIRQTCYTSAEACGVLGVSSSSLRLYVCTGKLTCVQRPGRENYGGLYPKAEVDAFAQRQRKAHEVYV